MNRILLSIILFLFASSIFAKVDQDTMPFLVMPDGEKVMATHVLKFPLKREASGLAYDPLNPEMNFITVFDKGSPQLCFFGLTGESVVTHTQTLSEVGKEADLEGLALVSSSFLNNSNRRVELFISSEDIKSDSTVLVYRSQIDANGPTADEVKYRTHVPNVGKNVNWEGIAFLESTVYLAKERDPAGLYVLSENGDVSELLSEEEARHQLHAIVIQHSNSLLNKSRIDAMSRIAFSDMTPAQPDWEESEIGKRSHILAVNRPARAILSIEVQDTTALVREVFPYELVDHPLEWTGTDTGDLLYGLVEGIAIGQVNGVRSLVMITDPGYGNFPKVVVFPWVYTDSAPSKSTK